LNANADKGADLASKATQGLASEADSYQGNVANQVVDATKKAGDAGQKVLNDANSISSAMKNNIRDHQGEQDKVGSTQFEEAKNLLNSTYGGPKPEDYVSKLKVDGDALKEKLGSVGNSATQQDLAKQAYGKDGQYSSTWGALDSFLMQGSQGGRDVLNTVQNKATDIERGYGDAASKINEAVQNANTKIETAKNQIKDTAKDVKGNIVKKGEGKVADLNKAIDWKNIGASSASLGDGLTEKNVRDIEALDSILSNDFDLNQYLKTWKAGEAPPVQQGVAMESPISTEDGRSDAVQAVNKAAVSGAGQIAKEMTKSIPTLKKIIQPQPIAKTPTIRDFIEAAPKLAKPAPWLKNGVKGASSIINGNSKKSTGTGIDITAGALQIPTGVMSMPDVKPVDPATVPANPKEIEDLLNGLLGY
jgi:hypothetical protein